VGLYDALMQISPSPVVALGRAMAIAEHDGPAQGLAAIGAIEDTDRLSRYPFYPAAIAELELRCGRPDAARQHFGDARKLARNDGERRFLDQRIADCSSAARS
jgi:RNA polymerase sigma-70 factor (ECF subfamily)